MNEYLPATSRGALPYFVLAILLAPLVALGYVPSLHPSWGVDAAHYLDRRTVLSCAAASIALGVAFYWLASRPRRTSLTFLGGAALLALFAVLAWLFRDRTLVYGDGLPLASSLIAGRGLPPFEPLAQLVQVIAYQLVRNCPPFENLTPIAAAMTSTAMVSILSGVLATTLLWRIGADHPGGPAAPAPGAWLPALVPAVVLSQGHVAIFAGYAENYAVASVAMLAYLYCALRAIGDDRWVVPTGVVLAVGCLCHLMALVLAPSWLLLTWRARGRAETTMALGRYAALVAAPALIFAPLYLLLVRTSLASASASPHGLLGTIAAVFVSVVANQGGTLIEHLRSLANGVLLVGPLSFALGLLALGTVYGTSRGRTFEFRFLALLVLPATALAVLIGDTNLGYARNWDVLTPLSVLVCSSGAVWLRDQLPGTQLRRLATCFVAISLLHTLPWLALNANERQTLARFATLPLGPGRAASTLGLWHAVQGRNDEAESAWKRGLAEDPNSERLLLFLGRLAVQRRRYPEAAAYYARARVVRPDLVAPLAGEALALLLQGDRDSARAVVRRDCEAFPSFAPCGLVSAALAAGERSPGPASDSLVVAELTRLEAASQ